MISGKTYAEKLKDPRWQKKRLEIFERDKWTCQACGDTTQTLNVHHRFYKSGLDPWEYNEVDLVTLCDNCTGLNEISGQNGSNHYFWSFDTHVLWGI